MPDEIQAQLAVKRDDKENLSGPGIFWLLIILAMILMALAVMIFGKSEIPPVTDNSNSPSPTESHAFRTYTVFYQGGVFSPTNLRIHVGDTVRFKNESLGAIYIISDPHPLHDGLAGFDSAGDIPQDSSFSYTFATKGTFGYHNEKNLNESGTIIVR